VHPVELPGVASAPPEAAHDGEVRSLQDPHPLIGTVGDLHFVHGGIHGEVRGPAEVLRVPAAAAHALAADLEEELPVLGELQLLSVLGGRASDPDVVRLIDVVARKNYVRPAGSGCGTGFTSIGRRRAAMLAPCRAFVLQCRPQPAASCVTLSSWSGRGSRPAPVWRRRTCSSANSCPAIRSVTQGRGG
jgi:hypothetical protein